MFLGPVQYAVVDHNHACTYVYMIVRNGVDRGREGVAVEDARHFLLFAQRHDGTLLL